MRFRSKYSWHVAENVRVYFGVDAKCLTKSGSFMDVTLFWLDSSVNSQDILAFQPDLSVNQLNYELRADSDYLFKHPRQRAEATYMPVSR